MSQGQLSSPVARLVGHGSRYLPDGWCGTVVNYAKAYFRMAATVIVATVTRMCLDCLGFLLSGQQNASSNYFWFSTCIVDRNHLQQSMTCLHMAAYLFVTSILFCAVVLWGVAQWITDPDQNPYARRYSFTILVDSLTWIPISVCVGKMNVLVDWLMGVTKDNATRALLTIECVIVVSGVTALVANLSLKYVQDVANASKFAERSFKAFCRVLVLTTLSTFPWAVGWNAWKVVLAVLDLVGGLVPASAAEWQKSVANYSVLGLIMMATMLFYSRFGPEPVIPDPHTQQVVNRNPHTGSVLRSMIALMVYSCCVFNVMVITDPTYGILYKFLRWVHPKLAATPKYRDVQALVTLFMWILVITFLCVIASVIITACTSVDMSTSAKVSRRLTVTSSGRQLFKQSPPAIGQRPFYSRQSSREAGFGQELQEELMPERCPSREDLANGDEAAGPSTDPVAVFDNDAVPTSPSSVVSMKICASIMIFDVLGLVVCMIWSAFSTRLYYNLLGEIAKIHLVLYFLSVMLYAAIIIPLVSRVVFIWFPSVEETEIAYRDASCSCFPTPEVQPLPLLRSMSATMGGRSWSQGTDSSDFLQMRDILPARS